MISLLGIVIGLALFILLAYMGYNTIIVAIASAMVVAVFGGMNPFVALTEAFMPKTVGFMQGYFSVGTVLEKLKTEGTVKVPFKWLYDSRQYDKHMDGCYMEITKITSAKKQKQAAALQEVEIYGGVENADI